MLVGEGEPKGLRLLGPTPLVSPKAVGGIISLPGIPC